MHMCPCNDKMDKALKNYFALETLRVQINSKDMLSVEDELTLSILQNEVCFRDGRFETRFLWKYADVEQPDNRKMALKRYEYIQKKLRRTPEIVV